MILWLFWYVQRITSYTHILCIRARHISYYFDYQIDRIRCKASRICGRSPDNAHKPKIWSVWLSQNGAKMNEIRRSRPKLISSEGGQDTSACQISDHSIYSFIVKCKEIPFVPFHWIQIAPILRTSEDRDQNIISFEGGQDTWACCISGHSLLRFLGSAWKPFRKTVKVGPADPQADTGGKMVLPKDEQTDSPKT